LPLINPFFQKELLIRASLGWFEDSVKKPACLMSGTGIKARQRVVVFSKGCFKWIFSHVNDRSIYNHANNWMSNSFIPNTNALKWEKTLDKNKTFNLFIKRSIKNVGSLTHWPMTNAGRRF